MTKFYLWKRVTKAAFFFPMQTPISTEYFKQLSRILSKGIYKNKMHCKVILNFDLFLVGISGEFLLIIQKIILKLYDTQG